ncbi:hypothetical protein PRIPAC_98079 [Pristionchus pacificus]|uniref:Leprecan-like alpha-helical domain-containing protein n=1 Tax=Pristionchus pacificus TaxID=54126 RepID=A0A2A6D2X8_PRIPA|nr:hypothetical protein PRIPAC_98079 [Pristionchus pacificus]|eukprot:PDM84832.1 hypothetical protein PRIPAC_33855 [Pristionchus pacificus]
MRLSLLLLTFVHSSLATLEDPELTFERLYKFGKDAYTAGEWADCVGFMRRALEDWDYYQSETLSCAARCLKKLPELRFDAKADPNHAALARFHHTSQRALCIRRCRRERFSPRRPGIARREIVHDLMERRPYNYLQVCHWKDGEFESAVKAAYTFLVANPTDEQAKVNMDFYMAEAEFTEDMLEDKERADYERMFISGVSAYEDEDWTKCVTHLDTALDEFFKEEELCRLGCRDRVDWEGIGSDDDVDAVINAIHRSSVECQHSCLARLSWVNGHFFGNLVAQVYRYQHLCYFKQMRGQDAARAVANHLLLDASPDIRWNKAHYRTLYPDREEIFRPEMRIVEFARNRLYEQRYLDFTEEKSKLVHGMYPTESKEDYAPLEVVDKESLVKDDFPYAEVGSILSAGLCKTLRQVALQLPTAIEKQAKSEVESAVQRMFPYSKLQGVWCGELRRPACDRAIVLSIEEGNCSEWLGPMHGGCALVACE